MKKGLFYGLIIVALIIALVGCTQPSPTTTPPTTTPPTTTPPTTTPPTTTPPTTTPPTTTPPTTTPPTTTPPVGGTIKIGILYELTGFLAPVGDEMKKGITVSLDVLGTTVAGKQVQFVEEDTASDANGTLDKARKLVESDQVALLIGPVHGGNRLALAGYLDRVGIPDVGVAGDVDQAILEHSWMWAMGNQSQTSYSTGIYAYDQGYRTASVLGADRSAGQEFLQLGFEVAFKEKGGEIIQEQWYPPETQDFTPYIVNIKPVDVLATWIGDAPGFAGFPQLKSSGNTIPIIQVEHGGLILSPAAAPELGNSIYGIVTSTMYLNTLSTPLNREFVDAYQARYGILPGPFAGMTLRTMQIIYEALKATNGDTSPQALATALSQPVDTVCGHYEWTPERDSINPVYLVRIGNDGLPQLIRTDIVTAEKVGDTLVAKIVG